MPKVINVDSFNNTNTKQSKLYSVEDDYQDKFGNHVYDIHLSPTLGHNKEVKMAHWYSFGIILCYIVMISGVVYFTYIDKIWLIFLLGVILTFIVYPLTKKDTKNNPLSNANIEQLMMDSARAISPVDANLTIMNDHIYDRVHHADFNFTNVHLSPTFGNFIIRKR